MRRRQFLPALGSGLPALATGLGTSFWMYAVEPHRFSLTRTQIHLPNIRPTRLLHLSDWHVGDGLKASELAAGLRLALATQPDLIALTGDFVSTTRAMDHAGLRDLLRRCADTAPTFATLGNHDGGRWLANRGGSPNTDEVRTVIAQTRVRHLDNQSIQLRGLTLVGLGDLWANDFSPARAFPPTLDPTTPTTPTIVLSHNPDTKDYLTQHPWHLMLSGHTHGGQGRIPFAPVLWAPVRDRRYISGLYAWQGRQLFISRGMGSPLHLRFNCAPELSLLELA
ncbi:MAG: phosphodiesterase YaeI [Bryobacter sp.]|nr:phosphodiesterase YaeI [Bryobacter sp.]